MPSKKGHILTWEWQITKPILRIKVLGLLRLLKAKEVQVANKKQLLLRTLVNNLAIIFK